jgi:hypothetical protein
VGRAAVFYLIFYTHDSALTSLPRMRASVVTMDLI